MVEIKAAYLFSEWLSKSFWGEKHGEPFFVTLTNFKNLIVGNSRPHHHQKTDFLFYQQSHHDSVFDAI